MRSIKLFELRFGGEPARRRASRFGLRHPWRLVCRAATSGPFAAAPPRIASPILLEAVLRSALRLSESPSSSAAFAFQRQRCIDDRRILALVDRALPDPLRLLAQPGQPDAHASLTPW
jgi:hypothetical protein